MGSQTEKSQGWLHLRLEVSCKNIPSIPTIDRFGKHVQAFVYITMRERIFRNS